jgi:hypothetical protein
MYTSIGHRNHSLPDIASVLLQAAVGLICGMGDPPSPGTTPEHTSDMYAAMISEEDLSVARPR